MSDYMVFVNGAPFNETLDIKRDNDTIISTLFPVGDCAAHRISVLAFNPCGESQKTPSFMLDPETRHTIPSFFVKFLLVAQATTYVS